MKENEVIVNEKTTTMNPTAPKPEELVKLHKEARPMRPLVDCIQFKRRKHGKAYGSLRGRSEP